MEHFEAPADTAPILIPYVGTEFYDRGDFSTYPERKGWKADELLSVEFDHRTPGDVEAFFQTWLYFGFLSSVFRIVGFEITSSDFIRETDEGHKVITTKILPELFLKWINREGFAISENNNVVAMSGPQPVDKPKDARGEAILNMVLTVLRFVETYCNEKARDAAALSGNVLPFWPVSEEIALSIMAVGNPVHRLVHQMYANVVHPEPVNSWGTSPLLSRRLKDAGWCIRDIPLSQNNIAINYFFGGYPSPRLQLDHTACTRVICRSAVVNVDVENYQPKHITEGCNCSPIVAPDIVSAIVAEGGIPILSWKKGELTVTSYDNVQKTPYVAISHVWSDGMGNDGKENALPRCQLDRMQTLVNQLYAEEHAVPKERHFVIQGPRRMWSSFISATTAPHVGFWMDTLCVPVGDGTKELRKAAIHQMGKIYKSADRVLILDSFIQNLLRSADLPFKFVQLLLSNWHRRLWTLQEAQLGNLLFFQFKDGAQTVPDITLTDDSVKPSVVEAYSAFRFTCLETFIMFYDVLHWFQGDTKPSALISNFIPLCHNVRSRATSKVDDEPLCLTTILGLDSLSLLDLQGSSRMERFYELVGHYEPRIIFNSYPRLERDGFRWAPRSFLEQSYELFTSPPESGSSRASLYPDGGGLKVTFPGIILETMQPHFGAKIAVLCRKQDSHNWCELSLLPDEHGKYLTWDSSTRYTVIYSSPSVGMNHNGSPTFVSAAILGIFVYKKQGRVRTRFLCRAVVELRDSQLVQNDQDPVYRNMGHYLKGQENVILEDLNGWVPVRGKLLGGDQRWCIL